MSKVASATVHHSVGLLIPTPARALLWRNFSCALNFGVSPLEGIPARVDKRTLNTVRAIRMKTAAPHQPSYRDYSPATLQLPATTRTTHLLFFNLFILH